ncbi:MAG TPA: type I phosphomannose isomerase catalytic subunit [Tepidisphaeraceae bacterium]|nr:type I phosphomannose isomerase catalytic subunit [Tepidisphaeraceae bacterium]
MWGGRKLETVLGKRLPAGNIGESWELYDFAPGVVEDSPDWVSSRIVNGPLAGRTLHDAVMQFRSDLYGAAPLTGEPGQFPILIKFLDAREDLSLQVHPDQAYARAHPGSHLKSEAWYVLQSDPGSRILNGLVPGTTRRQFEAAVARGDADRLVASIPAAAGDCYYLPSGTVHALGAGILVAEVQTPSDTTFRVFDFNRIDPSTGKPRTLHVREAMECIDFTFARSSDVSEPAGAQLVDSPHFGLHRYHLAGGQVERIPTGSPTVLIGIEGSATLRGGHLFDPVHIARGEVVLVPGALEDVLLEAAGLCTWLQVRLPVCG